MVQYPALQAVDRIIHNTQKCNSNQRTILWETMHLVHGGAHLIILLWVHTSPCSTGSTGQRWKHVHGLTNVGSVLGK